MNPIAGSTVIARVRGKNMKLGMKLRKKWAIFPAALAAVMAIAPAAYSQVQTPISNPAVVNGNTGNSPSGNCGFAATAPSQVVRVTEQFTSLRFKVESNGQPTLLITGPGGRRQCVMADNLSGGTIEVPGVWERGAYSLFVGDRAQASRRFTLTITQE